MTTGSVLRETARSRGSPENIVDPPPTVDRDSELSKAYRRVAGAPRGDSLPRERTRPMKRINKRLCIPIVAACVLHGAGPRVPTRSRTGTRSWRRRCRRRRPTPSSRRAGRDRAARRLRGGQRCHRGLRTVPRDHYRTARGLARRRGHRRRPSDPGDPAPGSAAALDACAGPIARGDPGRPGEGCRHRCRRGRRGRHAPAPGQRWLGRRRALHAREQSR